MKPPWLSRSAEGERRQLLAQPLSSRNIYRHEPWPQDQYPSDWLRSTINIYPHQLLQVCSSVCSESKCTQVLPIGTQISNQSPQVQQCSLCEVPSTSSSSNVCAGNDVVEHGCLELEIRLCQPVTQMPSNTIPADPNSLRTSALVQPFHRRKHNNNYNKDYQHDYPTTKSKVRVNNGWTSFPFLIFSYFSFLIFGYSAQRLCFSSTFRQNVSTIYVHVLNILFFRPSNGEESLDTNVGYFFSIFCL